MPTRSRKRPFYLAIDVLFKMKNCFIILFLGNISLINKFILFFFLYVTFCQNEVVLLFINNNDIYTSFTRLSI